QNFDISTWSFHSIVGKRQRTTTANLRSASHLSTTSVPSDITAETRAAPPAAHLFTELESLPCFEQ
ncbi:UNVERIFIED_CONTAM: hypothetical protein NY603_26215, partial [Bacteroidetes bacterium 56_B9]